MRPRLHTVAATGLPVGRLRLRLADEIDPWPAEPSTDALIQDHARRAVRPWEVSMLLCEKGKKGAEPVSFGWDDGQAALQAGTHEVVKPGDAEDGAKQVGDGDEDDGLDDMKRDELDALAEARGVDVSEAKTKADVIKALRAAA